MRTSKSIRNIASAVVLSLVTMVVGLVAQKVFLNTLGTEYLGINGLFTSIVSVLALAELGLGTAIYFHLYKPVADNDQAKIKSLVSFYKKAYRFVAVAIFGLGLLTLPFLGLITGDVNINQNIYIIYLFFLVDIVFSYLLTYKRSVLYADQNNHVINLTHLVYFVVLNVLQIAVLILTHNYYLYLTIKIAMRVIENVALTLITNHKYKYLTDPNIAELDSPTKQDIYKKIRGLSFHRIGSFVVVGTDNIIISIFFGVSTVGLYSNYTLILGAIYMLMNQAFTAVASSVGNLLAGVKSSKTFEVYKRLRFANFWLSCFAAVSFLVAANSFISVWVGQQFLLPIGVLIALSINLYVSLARFSIISFKEPAGIFHEDRYVPIVESVANIVFAVSLLHVFGLAGVFIGTILSTLIVHLYSYPKFVYKPLFRKGYYLYYKNFFLSFLFAAAIGAVTFAVSRAYSAPTAFTQLIYDFLICLIIPNLIMFIALRKTPEFGYYKTFLKRGLSKLMSSKASA